MLPFLLELDSPVRLHFARRFRKSPVHASSDSNHSCPAARSALITIYLLCFQSIAHSFAQWSHRNSFHINHFRTLSRATEGEGKWQSAQSPVFRISSKFLTR